MLALPARIDLISVPVSTSPASNVSSIVNSWRAFRLRATVESSRMGWLLSGGRGGRIGRGPWPSRTNAGPMRTGVRVAYPPTGCPTRRPSPARWCSYAYCRSLHITSFRSAKPYPKAEMSARASIGRYGPPMSRPAGARAEDLERPVEDRDPGVGSRAAGSVDRDVGLDADVVDPALRRASASGRSVRRNAPPSPASSCHCWTVPLPNDRCPTSVARPVSWSAPATISLADALPPSIEARRPGCVGSVAAPPGMASVGVWSPFASCSQKIGPER